MQRRYYIGLMSGTSMDGVDAVLLEATTTNTDMAVSHSQRIQPWRYVATHAYHLPMPQPLRDVCLRLNRSGDVPDELHQAALAANALSQWYARAVANLLSQVQLPASAITAIGAHGQTVRHQPPSSLSSLGEERSSGLSPRPCLDQAWTAYTLQLLNPALLAELSGIAVVADFRSRDVAAGGQGAPLVPAFHQAMFAQPQQSIAVLNIGGMANVSLLNADGSVQGFDTGPGNVLLDAWSERHTGQPYDAHGAWAASGTANPELLQHWLADPYFQRTGPRSTGRDYFHIGWIEQACQIIEAEATQQQQHQVALRAVDVQATLLALTVDSIAHALHPACPQQVIVCGGGVFNAALMQGLRHALAPASVSFSDDCGLPAMQVEAAAFAWLAHQALIGQPGNIVRVTGAAGPRVLGAIYPA